MRGTGDFQARQGPVLPTLALGILIASVFAGVLIGNQCAFRQRWRVYRDLLKKNAGSGETWKMSGGLPVFHSREKVQRFTKSLRLTSERLVAI